MCTFILGGLRGSTETSDLVDVCVCVYVCVCHHGHFEGLLRCRLVGSCYFLHMAKTSLHVATFARLTQSQAISQTIAFSSLSDQ